jgi:hypothetical protein
MKNVWEEFAYLLDRRFKVDVITTEDSVRYTFFAALLRQKLAEPEEVILELPHPKIARAEIDTWIVRRNDCPIAIEFKYDRQIPSGHNSPRPMKAGKLFNDLFRLALICQPGKTLCYFVYLTDSEMASYLQNKANGLADFFDCTPVSPLFVGQVYIEGKSTTFQTQAGEITPLSLVSVHSQSLPKQHELRVFEVRRQGTTDQG